MEASLRYAMATAMVLLLAAAPAARGDVFHLRGGGRIEGEIARHKGDEIVIEVGGGTVTVPADMVERIEKTAPLDEQYARKAADLAATADAHVDLARWCEDKGLWAEAHDHYMKAIELDPDQVTARARLGFVKVGQRWVTRSEARQMERQRIGEDRQKAAPVARHRVKQWDKELRELMAGPLSGWQFGDAGTEARETVLAIDDPAAVEPLQTTLGRARDETMRRLAAEALGGIGGDAAALGLVEMLAEDPSDAVAEAARQSLAGIESEPALWRLKQLARIGNASQRARASAALADAGTRSMDAVPNLISQLITREVKIIHHEPEGAKRAWIADGVHRAYVSDVEPVVAEAAVGFDPVISYLVSGVVLDVNAVVAPWKERVNVTVRHPEVLDSLRRLTGQDFGYDIRGWRRWYFHEYLPNAE